MTESHAAEIEFDRVTKRYAGRGAAALAELSLEIPAGTFCVLVGPSGGGKTTALKLINRLIDFEEGDVRIDGRSVREIPVVELRRGIGYVIQQIGLFPHMTIAENVATVPRLLGWPKARTRDRVAELLALVGLEPDDGPRYPAQLSGGQRQRVGLARALAADPPVLLMDEPFGALDPITRARLQQELRRLQREVSKTIVFVTHDIDEAITMGDRIAILAPGGVLAQYDTPDAILANPADEFVEQFVGEDRALRRLALRRVGDVELDPVPVGPVPVGPVPLDAVPVGHGHGRGQAPAVAGTDMSPADVPRGQSPDMPVVDASTTVRNAVSLMLQTGTDRLLVAGEDGAPRGILRLEKVEEILK